MRSASVDGSSSSALRSIDSVGSISRRRRSSASVRKISQASLGASKYSRRSPLQVAQSHQPPGLQLLQSHADVGARELQPLGDIVGVQRSGRDEDQCVDLSDGAVDAPAAAHLAEVGNEALHQGRERCHGAEPIQFSGITENSGRVAIAAHGVNQVRQTRGVAAGICHADARHAARTSQSKPNSGSTRGASTRNSTRRGSRAKA